MVQINCSLVFILTATIVAPVVALPIPADDPGSHQKKAQFYQQLLNVLGVTPQAPQAPVQTVDPAQ